MEANWMFSSTPVRGLVYPIGETVPVIRVVEDYDAHTSDCDASGWADSLGAFAGPASPFMPVADPTEYAGFSSSFNSRPNSYLNDPDSWANSPTPSATSTAIPYTPPLNSPYGIQPGDVADFDTTSDPGRQSLEGSASPKPQPAPRHATEDDFAKHKSDIRKLYLDRNFKLKDVKKIMETRHGFSATNKMYKSRFDKWGWYKYKRRRNRSDSSPSPPPLRGNKPACRRHSPSRELLREDEVTQQLNKAFRAFADLLEMYAAQDPEWFRRSRFEPGYLQCGLNVEIAAAVNLIHEKELWSGRSWGKHLRSGFEAAGELLSDLDLRGGIDLLLWTPGELVALESSQATDILARYLRHLEDYCLTSRKISPLHPIWQLIVALRHLAKLNSLELRSFVVKGTDLLTDFTSRRVSGGGIDRTHVDAMSFSLFLKLRISKGNLKDQRRDYDRTAKQLVHDRKALIECAKTESQPDDTLLRLQDDLLSFQDNVDSIIDFSPLDFVEQSHNLMKTLSYIYGEGTFTRGAKGWSILHASIYAARVTELARHFFCTGQPYRALSLLPDIMVIPTMDLTIFIHTYIGIFLFLIDQLRKPEFGLHAQASKLSKLLQTHQGAVPETEVTENFQFATLCSISA